MDLPPSPSLSPSLHLLYLNLTKDNQRLFIKVYKYLWGVVCPLSRFVKYSGVLYSFWAVDRLRHRFNLSTSQLAALSYIYQVTNKGANIIHSNVVYNGMLLPHVLLGAKQHILSGLVSLGYVSRSTKDASAPYLSRSYSSHPVFIRLTSSGVALIEGIEKDLYGLLLNTSLNELTGTNKKP